MEKHNFSTFVFTYKCRAGRWRYLIKRRKLLTLLNHTERHVPHTSRCVSNFTDLCLIIRQDVFPVRQRVRLYRGAKQTGLIWSNRPSGEEQFQVTLSDPKTTIDSVLTVLPRNDIYYWWILVTLLRFVIIAVSSLDSIWAIQIKILWDGFPFNPYIICTPDWRIISLTLSSTFHLGNILPIGRNYNGTWKSTF